jgi:hypothetical protein
MNKCPTCGKTYDDKNSREIKLTGGNIRHNHIRVANSIDLFPKDVKGGNNKRGMGKQVLIKTAIGLSFYTDIAGDKEIFRNRGDIGRFLKKSRLSEGDIIVINKINDYEYCLTKK